MEVSALKNRGLDALIEGAVKLLGTKCHYPSCYSDLLKTSLDQILSFPNENE